MSEHYKMILFKKVLKASTLRELLQVREFDTLEDFLDGARGLNPKYSDSDTTNMASKPAKKAPSTPNKPKARGRGGQRCTSTRCSETERLRCSEPTEDPCEQSLTESGCSCEGPPKWVLTK
ncbi:unnamed protein product [Phytophthora fragariaefolia]|uniref:Unnamed protein product n=1 Tax=Phytophthora fragariaefolia TaxID=1490495 RepID=A0A9W6Y782_9STRA|nr:unnamed protein product [Phytophthora fragariaefolia]